MLPPVDPDSDAPRSIRLDGQWTLSQDGCAEVIRCPIPGDIHSALIAAGRIPDPYCGENERDVQWVGAADWTLTRMFDLEERLDGLWPVLDLIDCDTVAEVTLNGSVVGTCSSAFQRHRIDLTGVLRPSRNDLTIRFRSAEREAAARAERLPFPVPYSMQNNKIPHLNTLRKPQCHGGWDWGPALMVLGLYQAPVLRFFPQARIEHVAVVQAHEPGGHVTVSAQIELRGSAGGSVPVRMALAGSVTEGRANFDREGMAVCRLSLAPNAPALWWPNGLGPQVLHDLTITIPGDRVERRIGLRAAEVVVTADGGMMVRVNGRDVFCRGANWIPADALPSRVTADRLRLLLGQAKAANMNMLRVWGGGFYESEAFYDLCDELGLMVWQDLMFACSQYPSTPDFLAEVDAEVRYQVKRLGTHPSIILWCGDNEVIGSLGWYEQSRNNRDRYLVNYDRLNRTLETAVAESDPSRRFWPSSPCKGTLDYGDAWHDDSAGDMHYWSVWHENKPFEAYYGVKPRFCSEFGFQSFPTMTTIRGFAPPDQWNATAPVMEWHQRDPAGNARIIETMARLFRMPERFDEFVYLSQLQQALAIDTAVRYWRSLKPWCMGALYWQLNDVWPAVSWSSLDHSGAWKSLHHHARRFFAPLALAPRVDGDMLEVKAINDGTAEAHMRVRVRILDIEGRHLRHAETDVCVPADRAISVMHCAGPVAAREFAVVDARRACDPDWDPSLQCTVLSGPPKHYAFSPATVEAVFPPGRPSALRLSTDRPALYVLPELEGEAGAFDDASILLLPGEDRVLSFRRHDGRPVGPSAAISLHGLGMRSR